MYIDIDKIIKDTVLIIISVIIILALIFAGDCMFHTYKMPIDDDAVVIITDEYDKKHLYTDYFPPSSDMIGKNVEIFKCFDNVSFKDTVTFITESNIVYQLEYNVIAHLDKGIMNDNSIYNVENFGNAVNDANEDVMYLCQSIHTRFDKNTDLYIEKNLKNDIKSVLIYNGFKADTIDINIIKKWSFN
ncbi:MAG: hypothetical protein [Wendovervirus sonii]|uniref:Uncharacterized protein n=1 Tax=phage Lak_Megaphage_Sonny TaxID=3109229 RepID=A0ABZ0Z368_9CAUD|nr:MAG: hypothetical protein [phage Lak_Megaphage_Sonny]